MERGRISGLILLIILGKIWIVYVGKRLSYYFISNRLIRDEGILLGEVIKFILRERRGIIGF